MAGPRGRSVERKSAATARSRTWRAQSCSSSGRTVSVDPRASCESVERHVGTDSDTRSCRCPVALCRRRHFFSKGLHMAAYEQGQLVTRGSRQRFANRDDRRRWQAARLACRHVVAGTALPNRDGDANGERELPEHRCTRGRGLRRWRALLLRRAQPGALRRMVVPTVRDVAGPPGEVPGADEAALRRRYRGLEAERRIRVRAGGRHGGMQGRRRVRRAGAGGRRPLRRLSPRREARHRLVRVPDAG